VPIRSLEQSAFGFASNPRNRQRAVRHVSEPSSLGPRNRQALLRSLIERT